MDVLLTNEENAARLKKVDLGIMELIAQRIALVTAVGRYKLRSGGDIVRRKVEKDRLATAENFAYKRKVSADLMRAIFYLLINEACKVQLELRENPKEADKKAQSEAEWHASLKQNLLTLTEHCCETYDRDYEVHAFATKSYLHFERVLMEAEIEKLQDQTAAVDLGCATGRLTDVLIRHFERIAGYDISQHMVAMAWKNADVHGLLPSRVSYEQADVEEGIPAQDASASFVVMNLGTASDMRNIDAVIAETMRVLKPGGRLFFSFYNREALMYQWDFLPWPVGLAASINLVRNCLEVHLPEEVLEIYARPYSSAEVETMLREAGVRDVNIRTFPTISSILPDDLFEGQWEIQKTITSLDEILSTGTTGAYIIATGQK